MPTIKNIRYRPEIDGLRALAVLSVVLFHAGFGCRGGYVGVDVFFVISGFLITSLIWKDLEAGRFTFANFWERRARRIMPALLLVTLATLAAGWFLLLPTDYNKLGQAIIAQSAFAANFYYWQDSGYFSGTSNEKPLLHMWSLAVEEQFYVVVPFLLWATYRIGKLRHRSIAAVILAIGFLLSFSLSICNLNQFPSATFYLLPTRAWKLLLGSLVSFAPTFKTYPRRVLVCEFLSLLGISVIFTCVFKYNTETPFPGLAALPPCLGTALVIWSNGRDASDPATIISKILSIRPLIFLGSISYSLYLWHWPLLAFGEYFSITPSRYYYRATLLLVGFVVSIISWRYVETPFRVKSIAASRRAMFACAGSGIAAVFALGLLCVLSRGFPHRLSEKSQRFANAVSDVSFRNELTTKDVLSEKFVALGDIESHVSPKVFVWGDSHAMAVMPAIDALLKEKGMRGYAATHSHMPPVVGWSEISKMGVGTDSVKSIRGFNTSVLNYIKRHNFSDVILCAFWRHYRFEAGEGSYTKSFDTSLLSTIKHLSAAGCRTWLFLDVPTQEFNVPKALSRRIYSSSYIASICAKPSGQNEFAESGSNITVKIKSFGGRILDPKPMFLDSTHRYYVVEANDVALYWDNQHLTTKGAKTMLLPFLRKSLKLN